MQVFYRYFKHVTSIILNYFKEWLWMEIGTFIVKVDFIGDYLVN